LSVAVSGFNLATLNTPKSTQPLRPNKFLNRREFVASAIAATAGSLALPRILSANTVLPKAPLPALLGNRFVTHVSVVRVNQIEVTRDRSIGQDEVSDNTPEKVRARRDAFTRGCPDGRMTWGLTWLALNDQRKQYQDVRRLLAEFHDKFGDEITFHPGGYFAPMYNTREATRRDIHDGLKLVSELVGGGYRPDCLIAGFMDAENQKLLGRDEGIHVCQGQIWSQHAIDNGDGDGGICYPYYPSTEHYLKPAQGKSDFVDCVCLDGWTCDFLAARRNGFEGGFNSRMGVGPIETVGNLGLERGRKEMMDTTAVHFDTGFGLNGFGWVTAIWEVSVGHDEDLTYWTQRIRDRWPGTRFTTEGEFGLAWREHYKDNGDMNYRFVQRGTGAPGSEANKEIRWFMNKDFRLALLRELGKSGPGEVIDFTRYDLPAQEPKDPQREWSLMNVLNQKGTRPQDKPRALKQLSKEDQSLIFRRCPDLMKGV
jgi:hypothetical protein